MYVPGQMERWKIQKAQRTNKQTNKQRIKNRRVTRYGIALWWRETLERCDPDKQKYRNEERRQ